MSLPKVFETQSARVKGISFHPSRPWILTTLHSGVIQIWDYNLRLVIAQFDEGEGPVRGADFHPHLPLFVTGSDNATLRVWNYKQKRCLFVLKGHIDYIRTAYFHNELPWILSASDDQTMRIWNYQSRNCVNIITGHSHYVMCAQFHSEKNLIVSASLDSTVRIWDYSVLRKKLTEQKNSAGFIGIEIECIKILEGHEKGVNWACFHPSTNIIASGSDDRKIKLWKYTNEVAWEHSTILGHKNNVSCLLFDPKTQNLITNSEDKTLRIWNTETKTEILTEKKAKTRYWMLAFKKNGNLIACGHDEGLDVFQLYKSKVPHATLSNDLIVFAQGFNSFVYSIKEKKEVTELYQYKNRDKNAVSYIEKFITNPYKPNLFIAQVLEIGQSKRYFMVKKKESYLNYPTILKEYEALDSCFIGPTSVAVLTSPLQLKFVNLESSAGTDTLLTLKEPMEVARIFSYNKPDHIVIITASLNKMILLDCTNKKFLAKINIEDKDVKGVAYGFKKIAVYSSSWIMVLDDKWEVLTVVREKFSIKSVFWESSKILFYTTINHLKYTFMNGETGLLKTIDMPIHILSKLEGNKFLTFDEKQKVAEIVFPDYIEIEFKLAVMERKTEEIKRILEKVGASKKKILIKYLVEKGYADLSLNLVTDPEEKFSLAIQSSNFKLAFDLCNKVNTQQYWKMLGDEALKQGIYEAYQLSCQKLKNFDQLNFLYSLHNNTEKLRKIAKIAEKTNNSILAFNTNLFLNDGEKYEEILKAVGLDALSELAREAHGQGNKRDLLKRLGSRPLTPVAPVSEDDNFSNWLHNVEEQQAET